MKIRAFILLFLLASASALHADTEQEIFNQLLHPTNKTKQQDASVPGNRLFLDYKNGFRDMQFGDPVQKLGENINCKKIYLPYDPFGYKNKPLGCTRNQNYGSIVSIPIHDIEYIFHKINNTSQLTGINIYLYKSPDQYGKDFRASIKDKPKSLMPDPEFMSWQNQACKDTAEKFTEVWGAYYMKNGFSNPSWSGSKVKANLEGMVCNILIIESIVMQEKGIELNKEKSKTKILNEF